MGDYSSLIYTLQLTVDDLRLFMFSANTEVGPASLVSLKVEVHVW